MAPQQPSAGQYLRSDSGGSATRMLGDGPGTDPGELRERRRRCGPLWGSVAVMAILALQIASTTGLFVYFTMAISKVSAARGLEGGWARAAPREHPRRGSVPGVGRRSAPRIGAPPRIPLCARRALVLGGGCRRSCSLPAGNLRMRVRAGAREGSARTPFGPCASHPTHTPGLLQTLQPFFSLCEAGGTPHLELSGASSY